MEHIRETSFPLSRTRRRRTETSILLPLILLHSLYTGDTLTSGEATRALDAEGWKTAKGQEVLNQDLVKAIRDLILQRGWR